MTEPASEPAPGRRAISEVEWAVRLEQVEPLHQWGSTFLVDDGSAIEAWMRDVTGAGRHTVLRFEGAAVAAIREGVERIEAASRRAADLVTELAERSEIPLADLRRQEEASRRFVEEAEGFYRRLLDGR